MQSSPETILRTERLSKHFGGVAAVTEVDFSMMAGEVLCLIGPNGSGKTTLFNLISGLVRPSSGAVFFSGSAIQTLPPHRIARLGLGRTFQNARLFPSLSLLENLLVPQMLTARASLLDAVFCRSNERDERILHRYRAEALLRELADGRLYDRRNDSPATLSLGEQRMVEIMRVMALAPKLILMDEPTQGLNPSWIGDVLKLVAEIHQKGTSILMIEHKMSVVMEIADRVVVLNSGQKICEGTFDTVRSDPEVLHAYLGQ